MILDRSLADYFNSYSIIGSYEQSSLAVFIQGAYVVVAERVLVFRIMLVDDEFGSVVAVQSVFGGDPDHTVPVLIYLVDQTAGQFPVCCEEFI